MRSNLLIASAAALLAGTVLAFGQGAPERKDQARPGASQPGVTQEQPKAKGGQGAQEQPKAKGTQGAQKEEQRPSTSGQAPGASQPQGQPAQPKGKGAQKEEPKPSTSGQAPGAQPREQAQPKTPGQNQPGANQPAQNQPGANQPSRGQPGQTCQNQPSGGASVTLTTEQRTKIRTTVLEGRSAPRVDRVDFSLNVGTVVPRTVRVVEVPETIIEIHPEWRGYRYFVYKEDIIIVDPRTLAIVAVIEV